MNEITLFNDTLQKNNVEPFIERYNETNHELRFKNGSEILFRSCDKERHFAGMSLDGFAMDEPVDISEDVFLILQSRLSGEHTNHHLGVLASNPGPLNSWVYKYFFEKKMPNYYTVETSTYDNKLLPNYNEYISDCEQSFDIDYARRYLHGKWGDFEGLIYKDFKKERHTGDYQDKFFKYYIAGYDDGYRNPACLLIGGVDSDNKLTIIHEYYKSNRTNNEIAEDIKPLYLKYQFRKMFCDPSGLNAIETFKRKGMRMGETDNSRTGANSGINKLKSLFKQNMVFIDQSCKNLIKELESYRYEKDKNSGNYNEEPVKKDDHAVDALRYLVSEYEPFKQVVLPVSTNWAR